MSDHPNVPEPREEPIAFVFEEEVSLSIDAPGAAATTARAKAIATGRHGSDGNGKGMRPAPVRAQAPAPVVEAAQPADALAGEDDLKARPGLLWIGAIPLGAVAALAIFLFLGWLQPTLGGNERIALPQLVTFRTAKAEPPPPPRTQEQPAQETKKQARKRPTGAQRAVPRTQVAARPQFAAAITATSALPAAGGVGISLDFRTPVAIDSGAIKDKDVTDRARRRQAAQFAREMSSRGGSVAAQALSQFTRPRLINSVKPEYPREAREKEIAGEVRAKILISATGTVEEIEIFSAKPEGYFEEKARDALARWTFTPGKDEAGNSVAMYETVLLVFELEDAR
jgi:TonB family protein